MGLRQRLIKRPWPYTIDEKCVKLLLESGENRYSLPATQPYPSNIKGLGIIPVAYVSLYSEVGGLPNV